MARYVSAVPAYGRDYKSQKAVREDWEVCWLADRLTRILSQDFLQDIFDRGYINKDDKPTDIILHIRYKNLTMVCEVK